MSKPIVAITSSNSIKLNTETKLLQKYLHSEGYPCILYDWNEFDSAISIADIVIHKYVGSIRQKYNQGFKSYLKEISSIESVTFINSLESYKFGIKKDYVLDLQVEGFPVIPTIELSSEATYERIREVKNTIDLSEIVIKPIDGELAQDVRLFSELDEKVYQEISSRTRKLLIQPFIQEVKKGEKSLAIIMIDGTPHIPYGVKRIPEGWIAKSSECKNIKEIEPSKYEKDIAKATIKSKPFSFLKNGFFRIDFIGNNTPLINEVEIVNPEVGLKEVSRQKQSTYLHLYKKMLQKANETK